MISISQRFKQIQKRCLEISSEHNLAHIPSALSMLEYVWLISRHLNPKTWNVILGKPFGSGAYYAAWEDTFGWQPKEYHEGLNSSNCPFVAFGEQTIGNALGVAIGSALVSSKKVWCNLSDASLQMGQTLEALLFMLHHKQGLGNLYVTIDYNDYQVLDRISNILDIKPIIKLLKKAKINVLNLKNPKYKDFDIFDRANSLPTVIIIRTVKGAGIKTFEDNPVKYHYKTLKSDQIKDLLK